MEAKLGEESIMELRELNRLVYLRPDNGSLVNQRTMKTYNFTNSSYSPGQTAQAIINSGNDALWGPSSYLRVEFTKDAGSRIASGSILNLFKNVRLTHRSGEVLEYIQDSNVLAQILRRYTVSTEQSPKFEGLIGVPDAAATYVRCVPLWALLGVFNDQEQYIPPAFLAGAKLELDLDTDAIIFKEAGAMTEIKLELVLDSAQVYDSVQKQLLDEQADVEKSGLQYSYSTWFSTQNDFAGTNVNFDIQQSASVTEQVCAVLRPVANIAAGEDSFLFVNTPTQWQYRLGSQYMPQKPVTNSAVADANAESYQQALVAFEGSPHQHSGVHGASGVNASATDFTSGKIAVFAQSLEKSAAGLQLTGEPTNNSRILNLEMTKGAAAERVNVFLKYLRVANILGSNLIVDR